MIKKDDITRYQKISVDTNLLRKKFEPNRTYKIPSNNKKFDTYLKQLNAANSIGKGLPKFMVARRGGLPIDYKYLDDPNNLIDRLRLLIAKKSAGNNNHENEIQAIIEGLNEAKIIN